jgi:hypothetical protein
MGVLGRSRAWTGQLSAQQTRARDRSGARRGRKLARRRMDPPLRSTDERRLQESVPIWDVIST